MKQADNIKLCSLYESITEDSCTIHIDSQRENNNAIILKKIDNLMCNAKNFNDAGGLVALTAVKEFIEKLDTTH